MGPTVEKKLSYNSFYWIFAILFCAYVFRSFILMHRQSYQLLIFGSCIGGIISLVYLFVVQYLDHKILFSNPKTDNEITSYKKDNLKILFLSVISFVLVVINLIGLITYNKYSQYSEIEVRNTYLYLYVFFAAIFSLVLMASLKAFTSRHQQVKERIIISILLSFMTLFSFKTIITGFMYRSGKEYKTIDFKVVDLKTVSRKGKYTIYDVLQISLSSSELKNYHIDRFLNIDCKSFYHLGKIVKIKFYQTQDGQNYYVSKPFGFRGCTFVDPILVEQHR